MTSTSTPVLEARNVSKGYRPSPRREIEAVLDDVSLRVEAGEFAALIGPSGCGKSTLLNIIAGLLQPDSGSVLLNGDPDARRLGRIAYMHQRDLLLPWRTVLENARLGLELQGVDRRQADSRATELAGRFGISAVMDAYPWRLSGGMRQRAALLRAALPRRQALLLDEPFGALDAMTRSSLQRWLADVLDRADRAVILVTHDVEEALLLADRVHVMSAAPGVIRETIRVDLARPRPLTITTSARFVELKRTILDALGAGGTVEARP